MPTHTTSAPVSTNGTNVRQSAKRNIVIRGARQHNLKDLNLELPRESSSTDSLQDSIWDVADQLGYSDTFIDSYRGPIIDDHRPFLDAGIPAVDLIQVPFPSTWHTLDDTPERCSAESLEIVGDVMEVFLVEEADTITVFPDDPPPYLIIGVLVVVALSIPILYTGKS